jgi:hypothetical protein
VILISNVLGIWDLLILFVMFVVYWIVLRTSSPEISMILGYGFDLTIPLQYHSKYSVSASPRHSLSSSSPYHPCFVIRAPEISPAKPLADTPRPPVDAARKRIHQKHLDDYWPIFLIASLVELASFFLLHPDLFTLLVCLKTALVTAIWMGRRDGKYVGRVPLSEGFPWACVMCCVSTKAGLITD